jgi:hypothetical protein
MPKRIQLSRRKGYRKPEGAIVVSRPSKWGNMFRPDTAIECGFARTPEEARELCVKAFRDCMERGRFSEWCSDAEAIEKMRSELSELRGKDLACWCSLDKPCHADVLLDLANR